ncbi:hypothetical protein LP421_12325 [Rhizobium sp. RCAM05350]|nr:hypothetical protein LP421_12325 [Rhizobium sp. RCAM05350]
MSMVMHLAEAKPGQLTTSYKHYYIERPCRILVVGQHLKTKTKYQCLLRHISVGGAMVDFNANIMLPKHFFLQIDGFQEEIGCSAGPPPQNRTRSAFQHAAGAGIPKPPDPHGFYQRADLKARVSARGFSCFRWIAIQTGLSGVARAKEGQSS